MGRPSPPPPPPPPRGRTISGELTDEQYEAIKTAWNNNYAINPIKAPPVKIVEDPLWKESDLVKPITK